MVKVLETLGLNLSHVESLYNIELHKVLHHINKGDYRPAIARLEIALIEIILYHDSDVEFACHIVDMYRFVLNELKALAVTDRDINPDAIKYMSDSLDRIISNNEKCARKMYAG